MANFYVMGFRMPAGVEQVAFVTWQGPGTGNPNASTSPSFTPGVGDTILVGGGVGAGEDLSLPTSSSGAAFEYLGGSTTNSGTAMWWATTATSGASQTVSIDHSLQGPGNYQYGMFVWVLRGVGSLGTPVTNYVASGQTTTVTVPSTIAGSLVFAVGWDYTSYTGGWTPGAESTNFLGGSVAYDDSAGDTIWAQKLSTPSPGGNVTLTGDLGVAGQEWGVAAIEIRPLSYGFPKKGIGQTIQTTSYLTATGLLPTFAPATICGYFYYTGQLTDYQSIMSFDNSNGHYYFLGTNPNSDVTYAYTDSSGAINGPSLTKGKWYFWAMVNDNTGNCYAYLEQAGTALTTPSYTTLTINNTGAASNLFFGTYSAGLSVLTGYQARLRAWSSALSVAELNAERTSPTAVKAGALFDAPLTTLADRGGLSQVGTYTEGPFGPLYGVGTSTGNASNYLSRVTSLPTFNGCTITGYFRYTGTAVSYTPVMCIQNVGGYTALLADASGNVTTFDTTNGFAGANLRTGWVQGWYFFAITISGTTLTAYMEPAGTAITSGQSQTVPSTTTNGIQMLVSPGNAFAAGGYLAQVRAWSSVLSLSEINAERASLIAVKAGSLFDAPFTSTSALGGFTINGTLTAGP
jgi:hypothetical protein